jgi:hypothetical protein
VIAHDGARAAGSRPALLRWFVHLLLVFSTVVSLVLEPVLALHVIAGLIFVGLVAVHLVQRRRASVRLLLRLRRLKGVRRRVDRLAVADAILFLLTAAMLASGLWDLAIGHPTRIRWHAITGVALTACLVVHTLRRRSRLRRSQIR